MPKQPTLADGLLGPLVRSATMLFPGVVTVTSFAPVGLLGPLAFAIRTEMPFSASILGVTFAAFYVSSSLLSGLAARIVSRLDAMTVTLLGLGLASSCCTLIAFAPNGLCIVALTVLAGVANGVSAPALNLVIMRTLPIRRHGLGFGIRVAATPAASAIAALGAMAVSAGGVGWRAVFLIYGGAGFFALALAIARYLGARRHRVSAAPRARPVRPAGLPSRGLVFLAGAGFLAATGTAFYFAFIMDSLLNSGLDPVMAGGIIAVASWLGIVSRVGVGIVSDRAPDPIMHVRLIMIQLAAACIGMAGLAFCTGPVLLGIATLTTIGIGMSWGGLLHHSGIALFPHDAARATSYTQSGTYAGTVAGSLLFGYLADHASFTVAWLPPILLSLFAALLLQWVIREVQDRPGVPVRP